MSIREIARAIADCVDVFYFSARKLDFGRGGGILIRDEVLYKKMRGLVPMFEGFLTYGGMSVREMEAITVGLEETMDYDMISHGPQFIEYTVNELDKRGIPVVKPAGGLGAHLNAMEFVDYLEQREYPAGALNAALYLASGVRAMERGTMSEERDADGVEPLANMELVRLAIPRRVFTLSQVNYMIDRLSWLYDNRRLIGGLEWEEEPEILRFFYGRMRQLPAGRKRCWRSSAPTSATRCKLAGASFLQLASPTKLAPEPDLWFWGQSLVWGGVATGGYPGMPAPLDCCDRNSAPPAWW